MISFSDEPRGIAHCSSMASLFAAPRNTAHNPAGFTLQPPVSGCDRENEEQLRSVMWLIAEFLFNEIFSYGSNNSSASWKEQRMRRVRDVHNISITTKLVSLEITETLRQHSQAAVRKGHIYGKRDYALTPQCAKCGMPIHGIPCVQFGVLHHGCVERGAFARVWTPVLWRS